MQKNSKKRKLLLSGIIILGIILSYNTLLKSDEKEKNHNLIAMYVQNDKGEYELKTTKEFPLSDYKLNTEKSSCKKGGVLSQDKRTNTVNLEVKSNDECNVYFDKETLSQRTLRILGLNYKENENINFFEPEVMDVTKDGLYSMEDDYGTSYYFRGME